jgi:hypothetical protein
MKAWCRPNQGYLEVAACFHRISILNIVPCLNGLNISEKKEMRGIGALALLATLLKGQRLTLAHFKFI